MIFNGKRDVLKMPRKSRSVILLGSLARLAAGFRMYVFPMSGLVGAKLFRYIRSR